MQNQRGLASIAITGVVLASLVFLTTSYIVGLQLLKNRKPQSLPSPAPTNQPRLQTSTSVSTDWEAYTDSVLHISFEYPKGWYVTDITTGSFSGSRTLLIHKDKLQMASKYNISIDHRWGSKEAIAQEKKGIKTIDELKTMLADSVYKPRILSEKSFTINTYSVFQRQYQRIAPDSHRETILLDGKGSIIRIVDNPGTEYDENQLSHILSSIQFID